MTRKWPKRALFHESIVFKDEAEYSHFFGRLGGKYSCEFLKSKRITFLFSKGFDVWMVLR